MKKKTSSLSSVLFLGFLQAFSKVLKKSENTFAKAQGEKKMFTRSLQQVIQ